MAFEIGDTVFVGEDENQNLYNDFVGFIDFKDVEDDEYIIHLMSPIKVLSRWIEDSTLVHNRQILIEK